MQHPPGRFLRPARQCNADPSPPQHAARRPDGPSGRPVVPSVLEAGIVEWMDCDWRRSWRPPADGETTGAVPWPSPPTPRFVRSAPGRWPGRSPEPGTDPGRYPRRARAGRRPPPPVAGAGGCGARSSMARAAVMTSMRHHPGRRCRRSAQLAGRGPPHRHVVLLHGGSRDAVDAGRAGQPAAVGHQGGRAVLGQHQAGVDARVGSQESGQTVGAGRVEVPVDPPLGDRRERRRRRWRGSLRRTRVGRRGSCRTTPPARRAERPGCRWRWPAPARSPGGRGRGCREPPRAPGGRSAASRRPAPGCRPAGARPRSPSRPGRPACWRPTRAWPGWGRRADSSGRKAWSVPSSPSTDMAAATSAVRSSSSMSAQARHSMPEHPVGAVGEGESLLGLQDKRGRDPPSADAAAAAGPPALPVDRPRPRR